MLCGLPFDTHTAQRHMENTVVQLAGMYGKQGRMPPKTWPHSSEQNALEGDTTWLGVERQITAAPEVYEWKTTKKNAGNPKKGV
jgi:hypothetical protein